MLTNQSEDTKMETNMLDNLSELAKITHQDIAGITACAETNKLAYSVHAREGVTDSWPLFSIPQTELVKGTGHVLRGVIVAHVPELEAVLEAPGGETWLRKQVQDALVKKVKNAVDNDLPVPSTVADFLARGRSSEFAAFNTLAGSWISALHAKNKALKIINKELFRQILASSAFAESQLPRVGQKNWVIVLQGMIGAAEKAGLSPGILQYWLDNREVAQSVTEINFETDDLAILVAKREAAAAAKAAQHNAATSAAAVSGAPFSVPNAE
jgi:hypothetical protein